MLYIFQHYTCIVHRPRVYYIRRKQSYHWPCNNDSYWNIRVDNWIESGIAISRIIIKQSATKPLQWLRYERGLSRLFAQSFLRRRSKKTSSSASLAFVRGIHRFPVYSPHKGPVTPTMFPFDDTIITPCIYFIKFGVWRYGVAFIKKNYIVT